MLIKLFRLARLVRLIRLLQFPIFAELRRVVEGVVAAVKVLFWTMVLLAFLVFFVGIVLRSHVQGFQDLNTLPTSMFTVFRCLTDGCNMHDGRPLPEHLRMKYGNFFGFFYAVVFMAIVFGLFNLITASIVDHVTVSHNSRRQSVLGKEAHVMEAMMRWTLKKLVCKSKMAGQSDTCSVFF